MLSLVHGKGAWVEANFKEKDLARMVPGQAVTIEIDAYPDQSFKGHVDSIGAGTGSEFSVIPAQNANGNWVKVTQRVPVRIAFDGAPSRADDRRPVGNGHRRPGFRPLDQWRAKARAWSRTRFRRASGSSSPSR